MLSQFLLLLVAVIADPLECERALVTDTINAVLANDTDFLTTLLNRFLLSGHRVNDLGQYRGWEHKADDSHYILVKLGDNKFWGLCLPTVCSADDVKQLLNGNEVLLEGHLLQNQFELYPSDTLDVSKPPTYEMTGLSWVCACLVFIQLSLVLISTGKDVMAYEKGEYSSEVQKDAASHLKGSVKSVGSIQEVDAAETPAMTWLQCFSLYHSVKRMHQRHTPGAAVNPLEMFNAVRVLSICWVLYGLCVMIRYSEPIENEEDLEDERKKGYMGFAYGAIFAVDTFFWMSGFFMTYHILIYMIGNQGYSVEEYAFLLIKRIFRIWPAYAIVLWIYFSILPVTGQGSLWEYMQITIDDCYDYWWTNILFLNNIIPDGMGNHCFRISWFVTVDFQILLFAPMLVWVYYKYRKICLWLIAAVLWIIGISIRLYLADRFNYKAVFIDDHNVEHRFWERFYTKPYCNWIPYTFGMLCACMYVNYKYQIKSDGIGNLLTGVWRNRIGAWGSLILGTAIITALVFPLMDAYAHFDNWTHEQNVTYLGLSSLIYSIAWSLVACSILFGKIPFILNIMTGGLWVPYSIPIYGVYLAMYGIVSGTYIGTYKSYWFQGFNIITDFIYSVCGSYILGAAIHTVFEVPFIFLEKILFPRIY